MSFDQVVDLVQAVAWPLVALAALLVVRPMLPGVARDIGRRATKISVYSVAIELTPAVTPDDDDARPPAVALMGAPVRGPSLLGPLIEELQKREPADYMVIDLLEKEGWLTSRMFLWARILPVTRSLRCFAFVRPQDGIRRFVALAAAATCGGRSRSATPGLKRLTHRRTQRPSSRG
jgi:hypothetical protein